MRRTLATTAGIKATFSLSLMNRRNSLLTNPLAIMAIAIIVRHQMVQYSLDGSMTRVNLTDC